MLNYQRVNASGKQFRNFQVTHVRLSKTTSNLSLLSTWARPTTDAAFIVHQKITSDFWNWNTSKHQQEPSQYLLQVHLPAGDFESGLAVENLRDGVSPPGTTDTFLVSPVCSLMSSLFFVAIHAWLAFGSVGDPNEKMSAVFGTQPSIIIGHLYTLADMRLIYRTS